MTRGTRLHDRVREKSTLLRKALGAFFETLKEGRRRRPQVSHPFEMRTPDVWNGPPPRRAPNVKEYCTGSMTLDVVNEILLQLGILLNHLPYAVCGHAAMAAHGFSERLPTTFTIACPLPRRKDMLGWITSVGLPCHPHHPDAFGVEVKDKTVRKISIEWMDNDQFGRLQAVRRGPAGVVVVTLPILVDTFAQLLREPLNLSVRKLLEGDLCWLLRRIVADGSPEQQLRAELVPHLLSAAFWRSAHRPDVIAELLLQHSMSVRERRPRQTVRFAPSPVDNTTMTSTASSSSTVSTSHVRATESQGQYTDLQFLTSPVDTPLTDSNAVFFMPRPQAAEGWI